MAERAEALQRVQFGVETTPGNVVPANRRLLATGIRVSERARGYDSFVPQGALYPTVVVPGRQWVEAPITARPSYTDLVYLLSSLIGKTTPVQVGSTAAYTWTFTPHSDGSDVPQTYTVEYGDVNAASRFRNAVVTGLEFSFAPDRAELSGTIIGSTFEENTTLTTNPTAIKPVVIAPKTVAVYLDNDPAQIGTTKLTRAFALNLRLTDKYQPEFTIDPDVESYAALVPARPNTQIQLTVEFDAQAYARRAAWKAGSTEFLRVKAVGPVIDPGPPATTYQFTLDVAVKWTDVGTLDFTDGIYTVRATGVMAEDETFGLGSWTVVTTVAAL